MNMISTGAFQTEMDASNKQSTIAEKFAAVWEKKNAVVTHTGGSGADTFDISVAGGLASTDVSDGGDGAGYPTRRRR